MDAVSAVPVGHTENDLAIRIHQLRLRIHGRLRQGLSGTSARYGLRRDLALPLQPPSARIPLEVRPLIDSDLDVLLPLGGGTTIADRCDIRWRRRCAQDFPRNCYVAVDLRSNAPCYLQMLVGPSDRALVRQLGSFPELERDEALLENAYTPPSHRGLGIMAAAMASIAERATELGARYAVTFVGVDNIASLKGCRRAGFQPHMLHQRRQLVFGTFVRDEFSPLAADDPQRTMTF